MRLVYEILFFCIYKMHLISAEEYKNAGVDLLIMKKTGEIWTKIKYIQNGVGVQNISDLVLNKIYGIYKTKSLRKEQIKGYKMTTKEIFENFDNLSDSELNEKTTKKFMLKMMLWLLLLNATEVGKKEAREK